MNRSEELYKSLNIRPRYLYVTLYNEDSFGRTVRNEHIITADYLVMMKNTAGASNPKVIKVIKIYPDPTKPSNFVKLYEMPIQKLDNGIIRTLGKLVKAANNRNEFIENIFERADEENSLGGDFWEIASNQAQRIEWEY